MSRSYFRLLALICAVAWLGVGWAAVYKATDASGAVIYSDTPVRGGKKVQLSPLHEYKARQVPTAAPSLPRYELTPEEIYPPWDYAMLRVSQPVAGQTYQNIGGVLQVELLLQPRLYPGDTLVVSLDGAPVIRQRQTMTLADMQGDFSAPDNVGVTLNNVHRGEHHISARIVRGEQSIATSNTVSVRVQQASKIIRAKQAAAKGAKR